MRSLAVFLAAFALALLLLVLGKTLGSTSLVYASVITFGLVAAGALLRGTFNGADWITVIITGRHLRDK